MIFRREIWHFWQLADEIGGKWCTTLHCKIKGFPQLNVGRVELAFPNSATVVL